MRTKDALQNDSQEVKMSSPTARCLAAQNDTRDRKAVLMKDNTEILKPGSEVRRGSIEYMTHHASYEQRQKSRYR